MSELFNRDISAQVGTWKVESRPSGTGDVTKPTLKMAFKVESSKSRDPNKAELQIWNLSQQSRSAMQTKGLPVILEAGYVGSKKKLFSGEMNFGGSVKQGTDWITTLQAGDGYEKLRVDRINIGLKGPVNPKQIVETLLKNSKIKTGNAIKEIAKKLTDTRKGKTQDTKGVVLSGLVADLMDDVTKAVGLEWSVQGGEFQLLEPTATTEDLAVKLTMEDGLVGTPEFGEKGIVKARSLLNGDLFPGRRAEIIARLRRETYEINGFFKVLKVKHFGDTWGADWYSDIEAKPL